MPDRENVIKGIKCLLTDGKCDLFNCPYGEVGSCLNAVLYDALAILKEQPEIVRCKDCIYWDRHMEECGNLDSACFRNGFCIQDWFCADGRQDDNG